LLGSTVVMLYPSGQLRFNALWQAGRPIRLGESMAST
jgi:phosphatidylserine decarboxylase